jgi:hypothetical protein
MAEALSDTQKKAAANVASGLSSAFGWARTPHGDAYWRRVHGELIHLAHGATTVKHSDSGDLAKNIAEFAEHREFCKTVMAAGMPCHCGLQALLERLS